MSANSCGCDPETPWECERHKAERRANAYRYVLRDIAEHAWSVEEMKYLATKVLAETL